VSWSLPPAGSGSAPPGAEVRARVMAAVRTDPVGSRAAGTRRRALFVLLALAISAAGSLAIGLPALRDRPSGYVVSLSLAWLGISVMATWAGVSRGRSMLGRPAGWRIAVAWVTPVALLASSLALGAAWPQTLRDEAGTFEHVLCFLGTIGFALSPLAAFLAIRRSTDPVSPRLTGAAIAAAAGAWGALAIELHCRWTSPWHVFVGHVLPVSVLAIAGVAAGTRYVAVRGENA
jgi:hypothetical protein